MKRSGVYLITNSVNGKGYVGSAVNIGLRWLAHLGTLRRGTHHNAYLQRAFRKYGEAAFTFHILEECPPSVLVAREQHWIDTLNTVAAGYNIAPRAYSALGIRRTPEQRERLRLALSAPDLQAHIRQGTRASWADPVRRAARLAALAERMATPEYKATQAQQTARRWADPTERARLCQRMREVLADPAKRARISQRVRERCADPVERAARAERTRAQWTDPAIRERRIQGLQAAGADPAERARRAERTRQSYADPALRAQRAERARALWADPLERARMLEARRAARERRTQEQQEG